MKIVAARLPLTAYIWIEAWLTLPWLPPDLTLPVPLSGTYLWSKVWAVVILPAFICLAGLVTDLASERRGSRRRDLWILIILALGLVFETLYLLHHIPPPDLAAVVKRWLAGAMALASLALVVRTTHGNVAPALEIVASAALVLAFISRATWAAGFSGAVLLASLMTVWVRTRTLRSSNWNRGDTEP